MIVDENIIVCYCLLQISYHSSFLQVKSWTKNFRIPNFLGAIEESIKSQALASLIPKVPVFYLA